MSRTRTTLLLLAAAILIYLLGSLALIDRQAPIYRILHIRSEGDPAASGQFVTAVAEGYHLRFADGPILQAFTQPLQWLLLLHDGPELYVDDLFMGERIDPSLADALRAHRLQQAETP